MVRVEHLVKRYRTAGHWVGAVEDISFEVAEGTFFTLLGPSGCGKTTTLRCIAGLERPEAGVIAIGGMEVCSPRRFVPPEDRPIGMVFQSYAIWPHMTVFDNAAFPLRYGRRRYPPAEVKRRVDAMLERLGLAEMAGRWANQLSGGQQQRLALARALLCEPALLLLDEPLSNLDAKLRASMRNELKAFQRAFGVTAVYVTHDQDEALALSDTVAVLERGRIVQVGTPRDLYQRPANPFVAQFIGKSTLIPGEVEADGERRWVRTAIGRLESRGSEFPGRAVWVCLRPEGVRLETTNHEGLNRVRGAVRAVEFLGDRLEAIVDVGAIHLIAQAHPTMALREGDHVFVAIPPESVVVIAREPDWLGREEGRIPAQTTSMEAVPGASRDG